MNPSPRDQSGEAEHMDYSTKISERMWNLFAKGEII